MVDYNPKEWIKIIFSLHKADTVRKLLPMILMIALYTSAVAYLIIVHWRIGENTDMRNISLMHSLLGFVISMLLVFRTNTAYDRWWEGRKQWGSLVNASRNLALKINNILDADQAEARSYFQQMIPNYCFALKNHLRRTNLLHEYENIIPFPLEPLRDSGHIPNHLANLIQKKIYHLQQSGALLPEHLLLLDKEIQQFTNICGACERIKNTPIPYSYSSFLKKFIMMYCLSMPFGYIFSLHYLIVPFVSFVFYVLASLEIIAEEIEDPFGTDANDLPLDRICENIRNSVKAIMAQS